MVVHEGCDVVAALEARIVVGAGHKKPPLAEALQRAKDGDIEWFKAHPGADLEVKDRHGSGA